MYQHLHNILRDLCLTPAPSGFELEIVKKTQAYLQQYCETVDIDPVGNVIGRIAGRDPSLRPVMVNAHMDRVGFIVSHITEKGYLKLCCIGTPNEKVLPGLTLSVRKKDRSGWMEAVVGTKCAHLMTAEDAARAPKLSECMIDVGADSAQQVREMGLEVGSPAVYTPAFSSLTGSRVCGTALDNCGSVAALIDCARLLQAHQPERDVYFVGNVWEEYNQRATTFPARRYDPVAVINMDMLLAGDTPDVKGNFDGALGQGPMVSCYNFASFAGCIAHDGLLDLAEQTAGETGTGMQRYVCVGGLGDNAYAALENDGPAVIEIGSPVRYAHSAREVADLEDIARQAILVSGIVRRIGADFRQARFA